MFWIFCILLHDLPVDAVHGIVAQISIGHDVHDRSLHLVAYMKTRACCVGTGGGIHGMFLQAEQTRALERASWRAWLIQSLKQAAVGR